MAFEHLITKGQKSPDVHLLQRTISKTKVLSDNQSLTETGNEILIFTGKKA